MAKQVSGLPENFDLSVTAADLVGPMRIDGYLDEDPVLTFARMQKEKAEERKLAAQKKEEEARVAVASEPSRPKPTPEPAVVQMAGIGEVRGAPLAEPPKAPEAQRISNSQGQPVEAQPVIAPASLAASSAATVPSTVAVPFTANAPSAATVPLAVTARAPEIAKLQEPAVLSPPTLQRVETIPQELSPNIAIEPEPQESNVTAIRPAIAPVDRKRFQINLDAESERMLEEVLDLLSSQSSENRIKISELFQALLMNLYRAKGEIALGSLPSRGRWGSKTAKAFPVLLAEALREALVSHEQVAGGNPFRKAVGG